MNQEQVIQQKVKELRQEAAQARQAVAEPLPGPLKDAFWIPPSIAVGPFSIRPFVDIDYEFLSKLNHPLHQKFKNAIEGKGEAEDEMVFLPKGPDAWCLFWIFTRSPDEVETVLNQENGKDLLLTAARKEFSRLRTPALAALFTAVMRQISLSNLTTIEYVEADKENGRGRVAEDPTCPPQSKTD